MPNLFSLFDDKLKKRVDLVASEPQSIESMSSQPSEQELILGKIREMERVVPKVDFSDFSKFVFFNSALDYFNITGELILNQYPRDGSLDQIQAFEDDLDPYQRHVLSEWPTSKGHLSFERSPASYLEVDDVGQQDGETRTGLLNPGTGSWSVDAWVTNPPVLTGSNDVMFLLQKGTAMGAKIFFSGSEVHFVVSSLWGENRVSQSFSPSQTNFYSFYLDPENGSMGIFTGSSDSFPVAVSVSDFSGEEVDAGSSKLYIGSGSMSGKSTISFVGGIDDLRIWSRIPSKEILSSSFNSKVYSQKDLVGLWRFNETAMISCGSFSVPEQKNSLVLDSSGHKLDGRIKNYTSSLRVSSSLVPYEEEDPICDFEAPSVRQFIYEQQKSGSEYDRQNDNIITRLVPDQFLQMERDRQTDVLEKFLFILARQFDDMKVRIDQFINVLKTNYGEHDQVPDALLSDLGKFFGWEFTGNFLDSNAIQYILGRDVLQNLEANRELDTKLYQIKNEFWRRTLNNLMYLYKTKGTRESVESLLRIYGVNEKIVRLKEYGVKSSGGIYTSRIHGQKSVPVLKLSGTSGFIESIYQIPLRTIEARVRFPAPGNSDMPPSLLEGVVWSARVQRFETDIWDMVRLRWSRDSLDAKTGSLILSYEGDSEVIASLSNCIVFDDRWHNLICEIDQSSQQISLRVVTCEEGEVTQDLKTTIDSMGWLPAEPYEEIQITWGEYNLTEQWMQEFRVWNAHLTDTDVFDHALNFQSYGIESGMVTKKILPIHLRMNDDVEVGVWATFMLASADGTGPNGYGDMGFSPGQRPFERFLFDYHHIAAPDKGWSEDKIRSISTSRVDVAEVFNDDSTISLEFNMIDALNEDISQIISTMEGFNEMIGSPSNKFRDSYQDLSQIRDVYFARLGGRLNFRAFFDMLEFFDRSFLDMVRRLLPARARFIGDEFVVESHMLERPKLQWNYRRQDRQTEYEGRISILERF